MLPVTSAVPTPTIQFGCPADSGNGFGAGASLWADARGAITPAQVLIRYILRREDMRTHHLVLIAILIPFSTAMAQEKEHERLAEAATVMKEVLNIPDSIPQDLLDKSECVVVFPSVVKAAIVVGGSYGRGAMTCRTGTDYTGPWSAPAMFALEGASIGFQLGGTATDFVLLVMNDRGAKSVLTSKVKLGGEATAAAGPKGRSASAATDAVMKAEILSYSRARGLFAGVSLEGSTLRADGSANKNLYGQELTARQIVVEGTVKTPPAAQALLDVLNKRSPKNLSENR
jgi:lipid-binding SYLF domain-containing protein